MSAKSQSVRLALDLPPRQRVILRKLANGGTIKEAALELKISTKTVEYHLARLREKVGLWCVADLTRFAMRLGLAEMNV